jgi:hypothetical protein
MWWMHLVWGQNRRLRRVWSRKEAEAAWGEKLLPRVERRRSQKISGRHYFHYSRIQTILLPSPHKSFHTTSRFFFLFGSFTDLSIHGRQLRPAACHASPSAALSSPSNELRVRDEGDAPAALLSTATPTQQHLTTSGIIEVATSYTPPNDTHCPSRPPPTDTAVSLATCSNPTPARLAFRPPMQGLRCQPIAAALA